MYRALLLVDPENDISLEQARAAIEAFYEGKAGAPIEIVREPSQIVLRWDRFSLWLGKSQQAHVIEESEELATSAGREHPARERIARCRARFEIETDDNPHMDHLNDFLFAGEVVARLGKVYRFHPGRGGFVE